MVFDQETHEAMMNPQKGDRFQEMYTHWVYVVKVVKDHVWTLSASSPCIFPRDGMIRKHTKSSFIELYSYNSPNLPNQYWVNLCDRKNDVRGWLLYHQRKAKKNE